MWEWSHLKLLRKQVLRVWDDAGRLADLWKKVDLEVGGEGVWEPHVARECREDEVAHLNARGRDGVAEGEVILAQELREVVQKDEEDPESPSVQKPDRINQLSVAQVGLQKPQEGCKKPLEVGSPL